MKDFIHEGLTAMKIAACYPQLENQTMFMKQTFPKNGQLAL